MDSHLKSLSLFQNWCIKPLTVVQWVSSMAMLKHMQKKCCKKIKKQKRKLSPKSTASKTKFWPKLDVNPQPHITGFCYWISHLCSRLRPVGSRVRRLCNRIRWFCSRIRHACTSIRHLGNRIRCLCNGIRRVCFRISHVCTGIRHSKIDQLEATRK